MEHPPQKPWISYYGGKQKMARHIVPMIPHHKVYVEPFFGGGAILFQKGRPRGRYLEVVNDIDERLINFYRVMQDRAKRKELLSRLRYTPHSEAEYAKAKDLVTGSDVDRAWAYFVNISQSFSNKLNGGWGRAKDTRQVLDYTNRKDRLRATCKRLDLVTIACTDAFEVIKQFDSPDAFIYCDPPYPGSGLGHYLGEYNHQKLQDLIDTLDQCEGAFMLSNYEQSTLSFPSEWEKRIVSTKCQIQGAKNSERTEWIWYRPAKGKTSSKYFNMPLFQTLEERATLNGACD